MTHATQTTAITLAFALAFTALFATTSIAAADGHRDRDRGDDISVRSGNDANVTNNVSVHANTGENDAKLVKPPSP